MNFPYQIEIPVHELSESIPYFPFHKRGLKGFEGLLQADTLAMTTFL
jgi:hypothetical protein